MTTPVLIGGAGIGGLTLALTLHQIGVPCRVVEAASEMKPLGVGINLQPNAVREFYDLGIDAAALDAIGVQAKEWALVGLNGKEVYAETRGWRPDTPGRNMLCIAGDSSCCSTAKSSHAWGRRLSALARA